VRTGGGTDPPSRPGAGAVSEQPARERDQLAVARLTGAAWRHACGREPTGEEAAAAVRDLREIACGRADLLAEVAGLLIGYYRRTADEHRARAAAYFCLLAGASHELIPRWIQVGCSRAAAARRIPPAAPGPGQVYAWPEAV
jgi:hypothetical protein